MIVARLGAVLLAALNVPVQAQTVVFDSSVLESQIAAETSAEIRGVAQEIHSRVARQFRRAYALSSINAVDMIASPVGGLQLSAGAAAHEYGYGMKGGLYYGRDGVIVGISAGHGRSEGESAWTAGGTITVPLSIF